MNQTCFRQQTKNLTQKKPYITNIYKIPYKTNIYKITYKTNMMYKINKSSGNIGVTITSIEDA